MEFAVDIESSHLSQVITGAYTCCASACVHEFGGGHDRLTEPSITVRSGRRLCPVGCGLQVTAAAAQWLSCHPSTERQCGKCCPLQSTRVHRTWLQIKWVVSLCPEPENKLKKKLWSFVAWLTLISRSVAGDLLWWNTYSKLVDTNYSVRNWPIQYEKRNTLYISSIHFSAITLDCLMFYWCFF